MTKNNSGMPLGLQAALCKNMSAMERFSMMNDAQQSCVIAGANKAASKGEMNALVSGIAAGEIPGGTL